MNIVNNLVKYVEIFKYIAILGFSLVIGIVFYYKKRKKKRKREDDISYAEYKKSPSQEFVKLEDIKHNMIIDDNYSYFTIGIKCSGFDYSTASGLEQQRVEGNYIELFNMIDIPVQYFVQCAAVDVESNIQNCNKAAAKKMELIKAYEVELNNLTTTKESGTLSGEELALVNEEIAKTNKKIKNTQWQYDHLLHLNAYTQTISESKEEPQISDYYLLSYYHDAASFSVELTKAEIMERAYRNLESKANAFISVLKRCNVSAAILTTDELIEIERRCYNPIGADDFKMRDVKNTNFYEMVVQSTSYMEKRAEVMQGMLATGGAI